MPTNPRYCSSSVEDQTSAVDETLSAAKYVSGAASATQSGDVVIYFIKGSTESHSFALIH